MEKIVGYYYEGGQNEHSALDIYKMTTPHAARLFTRNSIKQEHIETIEVSGKREARQILKEMGAQEWNF